MFGENYVNVPFDQSQGTNMFLRVINIKIMLNTNILGMTPTPLTFDMLHHHDLEKGRYPTAQYSLPYFTDSVKYPMDYLTSKTYSERVDFFFNKKRFNTMCRTFGTNYIDYTDGNGEDEEEEGEEESDDEEVVSDAKKPESISKDGSPVPLINAKTKRPTNNPVRAKIITRSRAAEKEKLQQSIIDSNDDDVDHEFDGGASKDTEKLAKQEMENADHNVRCMLILLLPIADEFMNVFQSSYDQYILNKPSPELYTLRNIDPTMLLNPTWLPFYNYFAARKYAPPIQEISYIKQGGAKYAVTNVIWLNDIVNHPIYREFLTTYYEKNLEKQNNRPKIKAQLTERLQMFRGLIQRNQSTKNAKTTLFMQMFETLLQNVNITIKTQGKKKITPSEQIAKIVSQFSNDANPNTAALTSDITKTVSAVTNPKDAAKRDSVIRMAISFAKIIATNNKLKQNGKLSNADWFSMADNIVSAYIEYSLYNESADKGMQINLKDDARIFTELYNQSLFLKALQLLDDFLHNRISRFDMNEKNLDGTPKSKLELDIIRIIQKSFPYYIKLNDDIVKHLRNVLEPRRRSSNAKLQSFLKNMFIPDKTTVTTSSGADDYQYALVEIYNKYIANTRKHIHKRFTDELMYTGVSTIVESDGSTTNPTSTNQKPVETPGVGNKPSGGDDSNPSYREIPEIYVYVNVVQKDEYEGSENRTCVMNDDHVANNLKRVLFTNTMLDDSFPEVNPYRVFQLLKGSENKTPFNAENTTKPLVEGNVETNKSNSQSPTTNELKGGSKRPPRNTHKYVPKRFARRNTRKQR
jgi:hypothetical protein